MSLSIGYIFTKLLYYQGVDVDLWEYLFMRMIIQFSLVSIGMGTSFNKLVFHSIPKHQRWNMVLKVILAGGELLLNQFCLKTFQLTIFSIFKNSSAIWTLIFGVLFFKERATRVDWICITFAYIGVVGLIISESSSDSTGTVYSTFDYTILLLIPVVCALNALYFRVVRGIPSLTIQFYSYGCNMLLYLGVVLLQDFRFDFVYDFNLNCYLLVFAISALAGFASFVKIIAYRHHQAFSLGIIQYLNYAFIFVVDVFCFGSTYSLGSLLSMAVIIIASFAMTFFSIKLSEKKQENF